jgi:predicted class III extradiol MEMO1 family dioxygenase
LLRTRTRLARDYAPDRDGAVSLTAVRMRAIGGDNVDNEFVALVIETENVRRQTLTVVKREHGDRVQVDFVQPLREFCIRHFA